MADSPTVAPENKPVPIRVLFISLLFSMFSALVVFAIASYFFLVPQIAIHSVQVGDLQNQVRHLNEKVAALQNPPDEAAAEPAPAAADPAAAPAPSAPAPAATPAAAAPAAPAAPTAAAK